MDNTIRKPKQKRSIETKDKIAQSGFELFCKKGYHRTNTIEIAKHANVSTGAVYSYFKDKRDIFIEAFEQYLAGFSDALFKKLNEQSIPFDLKTFIIKWITSYMEIYAKSSYALLQLRLMMMEDDKINHHFCDLENEYVSNIISILSKNGVTPDSLQEKVYIACTLIDTLNREKNEFPHNNLCFSALKQQTEKTILSILSL